MNILLVCSAGMSTSMLVDRMKKAAEELEVHATITATAEAGLANELDTTNVILIGPQVRYLENKITKKQNPMALKSLLSIQLPMGRWMEKSFATSVGFMNVADNIIEGVCQP